MEKLYKWLNGNTSNGGFEWDLPVKNADGTWTPGAWTAPIRGNLIPCENGYHLCREKDLIYWIRRDLYEAEYSGDVVYNDVPPDTKIVARSARLLRKVEMWNDRTARLFAVWCAREALKLVENPDQRSLTACDVAEQYANGEASAEELASASAAAWDAASAATWDAASAAARATTWDAASAAMRAATRAAAGAATWDAARDAQNDKLLEIIVR